MGRIHPGEEVRAGRQARAAGRREVEDREFVTAFASAIREHYPGCPAKESTEIAEHACRKYSGRIGRTAAAKECSSDAIRMAVIAHIRHVHTSYDELLARYADRDTARDRVQVKVSAILAAWQRPGESKKPTFDTLTPSGSGPARAVRWVLASTVWEFHHVSTWPSLMALLRDDLARLGGAR